MLRFLLLQHLLLVVISPPPTQSLVLDTDILHFADVHTCAILSYSGHVCHECGGFASRVPLPVEVDEALIKRVGVVANSRLLRSHHHANSLLGLLLGCYLSTPLTFPMKLFVEQLMLLLLLLTLAPQCRGMLLA